MKNLPLAELQHIKSKCINMKNCFVSKGPSCQTQTEQIYKSKVMNQAY